MMASLPDLTVTWTSPDGTSVTMRPARLEDRAELRQLYLDTYGDRYALPEVIDDVRSEEVLTSDRWLWMLAEISGEVVASLIFGWEPRHRLGKSFGGVVSPNGRGQKVMYRMLQEGLSRLLAPDQPMDLIYAVVRTFVTPAFHRDLEELGFIDVGVFPNVRKVLKYETHGLKVCLGPNALSKRRRHPQLIPTFQGVYEITRSRFQLEQPEIHHGVVNELREMMELRVELSPLVEAGVDGITMERIQMLRRSSRGLRFDFFPLHEANQILTDPTNQVKVFLSHQKTDGHSSILGVDPGPYDYVHVLSSVAEYCAQRGGVYLELLVSAYDPELQAAAYLAEFLPCAYFVSAALRDGRREDVVVTSRTFVPLHFSGLRLTETSKPYLLDFFKVYTGRLWEDLLDA